MMSALQSAGNRVRRFMSQPSQPDHPGSNSEYGSSMAWTCVVLSFLLIPLLTMIADGARLLNVRSRLQTATDAACEDASWSAADLRAFRDAGTTTFEENWYWIARAQSTFNQTLGEQAAVQYSAWVSIFPDLGSAFMDCQSAASVPLLVGAGVPINIHAVSSSRIRFRNVP